MNFRNRRRDDIDLNLTPLIDVVFLLLIFFMVSTTFDRNSELHIKLPEAAEAMPQIEPETVRVAIDAQDRVFINDQPLVNAQTDTLRDALLQATAGLDEPAVVIHADAQTSHQSVIRVMDAARQSGLVKITFATRVVPDAADGGP